MRGHPVLELIDEFVAERSAVAKHLRGRLRPEHNDETRTPGHAAVALTIMQGLARVQHWGECRCAP